MQSWGNLKKKKKILWKQKFFMSKIYSNFASKMSLDQIWNFICYLGKFEKKFYENKNVCRKFTPISLQKWVWNKYETSLRFELFQIFYEIIFKIKGSEITSNSFFTIFFLLYLYVIMALPIQSLKKFMKIKICTHKIIIITINVLFWPKIKIKFHSKLFFY